jgi:uncharacterized membrane protein
MVEKKEKLTKKGKEDDRIFFAFIASLLTIIGFIIAILLRKNDKYVMFYAKHGLILFIGQVIISLISALLGSDLRFFTILLWIFWVILWVMTWINALSGKEKETIIVSELTNKLKI